MILTDYIDSVTNIETFILKIDKQEVIKANLQGIDFALLRECGESIKISDKLLGLETLVRRIEESQEKV